ncbi:MAG: hypothetical protein Q7V57_16205 [Actinomycetota bacterium]|nr:hypothetical protein [Actinomycetota bacterium]
MKKHPKQKKLVAAGLTAGLVAGLGAGFALSATGSAGASANTSAVVSAEDSDTTDSTGTDQGAADHTARLKEVLQPLVDDNTLTEAQLDKVISTLEAAGPMGGGHGQGGPGRGLDTVATELDMTVEEVRTAISNGQTLAQLAESQGKTGDDLIDALVAELTAHLDEEVAAGEHTQAEADAKLAEATTRITEMVNNTQPMPAEGGRGQGGPGHGGPGEGQGQGGSTGTGGTIDAGPTDTSGN